MFCRVSVKVSGLTGPACLSSITGKEASYPLGCCCPLVATWLCFVGWMCWLAGIYVSGMVKMYSLVDGASCCCCCKVCGTNVKVALELRESVCCCVAGAYSFTVLFLNV